MSRLPDELCRRIWKTEAELRWLEELQNQIDELLRFARPRARLSTQSVMERARRVWGGNPFSFYFIMSDYLEAWAATNLILSPGERQRVTAVIQDLIIFILRKFESDVGY